MQYKIIFSCLLILALVSTGSAIDSQVPLPKEINIVPPGADLPKGIGAFSGRWEGTMEGKMGAILIVEEINPEKAQVIYAWSDAPDWNVKQGYKRVIAEVISGEKPTLKFIINDKAKFIVELGDDLETIKMVRLVDSSDAAAKMKARFRAERTYSREVKMKKVKQP